VKHYLENQTMLCNKWLAAVALTFGLALPAGAEIIKGTLFVRGAQMT
jgi:hypothetical protein